MTALSARKMLEDLIRRYNILVGVGKGIIIYQEHVEAINALLDENKQQREAVAALPGRWELELSQRWSRRWKALAQFRGWPASKHEKNRQRVKELERTLAYVLSRWCTNLRNDDEAARRRAERKLEGARGVCKVVNCEEPAYETSHFCSRHRGEVGPPTA